MQHDGAERLGLLQLLVVFLACLVITQTSSLISHSWRLWAAPASDSDIVLYQTRRLRTQRRRTYVSTRHCRLHTFNYFVTAVESKGARVSW